MIAIDFPFRFTGGSLTTTDKYYRIVRAQIVDVLMTNYRERVMRPEYGSDILSLVMAPQDELRRSDTESVIKDRVASAMPRAIIDSVTLIPLSGEQGARLTVQVRYRVNEYSEQKSLDVPLTFTDIQGG